MAVREGISAEKEDTAIDMMIALVVEALSEELHRPESDILPGFLQSATCAMLYDRAAKLWWEGPSEIASRYLAEMEKPV